MLAANPLVALFAIALFAAVNVPLHFIGESMDAAPSAANSQAALVKLILTQFGAYLGVTAVIGPLFSALAVYAVLSTQGAAGSLYGGLNYALSRYGKMFLWYFVVQVSVQVGLQLIVLPGILFFQMYAFVVPVLCLEKEEWPLARSKRLTQGIRRTIFLLFLPSFLIYLGFGLLDFFGLIQEWVGQAAGSKDPGRGPMGLAWFFIESTRFAYEFLMTAALTLLYQNRLERAAAARAAREAAEGLAPSAT